MCRADTRTLRRCWPGSKRNSASRCRAASPPRRRPPRLSAAAKWWWRIPTRRAKTRVSAAMPPTSVARGSAFNQIGRIPRKAALDMGRDLARRHPEADAIVFPSPHWPVAEAIEPLEQELGITVMTALQAIVWDALRRVGVSDSIQGFGRLLRDF